MHKLTANQTEFLEFVMETGIVVTDSYLGNIVLKTLKSGSYTDRATNSLNTITKWYIKHEPTLPNKHKYRRKHHFAYENFNSLD